MADGVRQVRRRRVRTPGGEALRRDGRALARTSEMPATPPEMRGTAVADGIQGGRRFESVIASHQSW